MGLFDQTDYSEDSDKDNSANALIEQQIQQNQLELQQKRDSLYQQQIGIVKSQSEQDFAGSNANAPIIGK